jgi:hypothetical protein
MSRQSHFLIRNDLPRVMILNIEPEGVYFPLSNGEEVSVTDTFTTDPVTLKLTASDKGEPVVSIWPGDGNVRVEKGGVDVFDLV